MDSTTAHGMNSHGQATRRTVLTAAVGSGVGVLVACREPVATGPPARMAGVPQTAGRQVQVVAHPDDDILFMNPDLAAGIRNGQLTLSIYLTGGESDDPNPAAYASRRQDGTRAAYARMAGVADDWIRQTLPVGRNRFVEVDRLASRPEVQVAFLNLPDNNNPAAAGGKHALDRLWQDRMGLVQIQTLVPAAGVVRDSYTYGHGDVIDVLEALFEGFYPSVIRTQDPQPDARYQSEWVGFHDHPDHVIAARFTWEATQRYLSHPGMHAFLLNYRDYNVAEFPVNLSVQDQRAKRDYFATYVQHDAGANLGGLYRGWIAHSYYRWPRGGTWARANSRGEIHAFAATGTRLVHWWRDHRRQWHAPSIESTQVPMRPALTLLSDHNERFVLLAQTWDGGQVLLKRQGTTGQAWPKDWTSLGNPDQRLSGVDPTRVGVPTATIDQQGRLVVFVRNSAGALTMREEKAPGGGDWHDWSVLGGSDVQDPPTAIEDEDNRLHVFAATRDRVLHWQQQPDGSLRSATTPFRKIQPAGPPVAVRAAGGNTRVFARTGDNGAIAGVTVTSLFGWQVPLRLPNPGGMGSPTVVTRPGLAGPEFLLFVRNSNNGISVMRAWPDNRGWTDLGGQVEDQPAAVVEPDGSVALLATGGDGSLLVNHEVLAAAGPTFAGWQPTTADASSPARPM